MITEVITGMLAGNAQALVIISTTDDFFTRWAKQDGMLLVRAYVNEVCCGIRVRYAQIGRSGFPGCR
jgi:hypothetical protein